MGEKKTEWSNSNGRTKKIQRNPEFFFLCCWILLWVGYIIEVNESKLFASEVERDPSELFDFILSAITVVVRKIGS